MFTKEASTASRSSIVILSPTIVFQKKEESSTDISCFVRSEIPIRFPTNVYLLVRNHPHTHIATASEDSRYLGFAT